MRNIKAAAAKSALNMSIIIYNVILFILHNFINKIRLVRYCASSLVLNRQLIAWCTLHDMETCTWLKAESVGNIKQLVQNCRAFQNLKCQIGSTIASNNSCSWHFHTARIRCCEYKRSSVKHRIIIISKSTSYHNLIDSVCCHNWRIPIYNIGCLGNKVSSHKTLKSWKIWQSW